MWITTIFWLFLLVNPNDYSKHHLLISLILFQNPVTEINYVLTWQQKSMARDISGCLLTQMILFSDCHNVGPGAQLSVLGAEYTGLDVLAVQKQLLLAGSGVTIDPWGYLWPITAALLSAVYSYCAQNPLPTCYLNMILCTNRLRGPH